MPEPFNLRKQKEIFVVDVLLFPDQPRSFQLE